MNTLDVSCQVHPWSWMTGKEIDTQQARDLAREAAAKSAVLAVNKVRLLAPRLVVLQLPRCCGKAAGQTPPQALAPPSVWRAVLPP